MSRLSSSNNKDSHPGAISLELGERPVSGGTCGDSSKQNRSSELGPLTIRPIKCSEYLGLTEQDDTTWHWQGDFVATLIGFTFNLHSGLRYGEFCNSYGYGAFTLACCVATVLLGVPLVYMEMAIAMEVNLECVRAWKRMCPLFMGTGIAGLIICIYQGFYSNTILGSFLYFVVSEEPLESMNDCDPVHLSDWKVLLATIILIYVVCVLVFPRIKYRGKIFVMIVITFYVGVFSLIGWMLSNNFDNLHLTENWSSLKDFKVWTDASVYILVTIGVGSGQLMTLARFNVRKKNCFGYSCLVCLTSLVTAFLVSLMVQLTHTHPHNENTTCIVNSTIPQDILQFAPEIEKKIISLIFILSGLINSCVLLETFALCLRSMSKTMYYLPHHSRFFSAIFLLILVIPSVMNMEFVVTIINEYVLPTTVLAVLVFESSGFAIMYITDSASTMAGPYSDSPLYYPWFGYRVAVTPLLVMGTFVAWCLSQTELDVNIFPDKDAVHWIVLIMVLFPIGIIVACMIFKFIREDGNMKERLVSLVTPEEAPDIAQGYVNSDVHSTACLMRSY